MSSQHDTTPPKPDGPASTADCFELSGQGKQDLFRDLVEQNPDLVLCVAPDGDILYANPTTVAVLGRSAAALADAGIYGLLAAESHDHFDGLVDRLIEGHSAGPAELTLIDADGKHLTVDAKLNGRFEEGRPVWFRVILRDLRGEDDAAATGQTDEEAAGPPQPRILVVEDDPICARMLSRMLERADYQTAWAQTAAEALDKLEQADFDAMTLDLALPDRDGVDLLHQIRSAALTASLPVIVVSASADEAKEHLTGDAASVVDWLNKPFEHDALRNAMNRAFTLEEGRCARVLHVEDDREFADHVRQTLADVATTDQASSLTEARRLLKENEDYDLVLLDLTLPDGLGAELLPFLNRPRGRSVPVILVSSSEATDALAAHVADTLVKSHATQQQLLETIRAHLNP